MNTCDHGHQTTGEIRALPLAGGANLLVCHRHYLHELDWRRMRARETGIDKWLFPEWESLEITEASC